MLAGSMKIVSPVLLMRWTTPGHLVPMVGHHGQHVVFAADRGVRITEDFAEFRVAEQALSSALTFSSRSKSFWRTAASSRLAMSRTWPRPSMQPPIDLADDAQVFDAGEHFDEAGEMLGKPHAIAVNSPGAGQRFADLEELLGRQHGADGGPAREQPNVVQSGERRRLTQPERRAHFGNEVEFLANGCEIGGRFDLSGQFLAERRRGIPRDQFPNLVELQQFQRVRVHEGIVRPIASLFKSNCKGVAQRRETVSRFKESSPSFSSLCLCASAIELAYRAWAPREWLSSISSSSSSSSSSASASVSPPAATSFRPDSATSVNFSSAALFVQRLLQEARPLPSRPAPRRTSGRFHNRRSRSVPPSGPR